MTILFYPEPLNHHSKLYHVCKGLNINFHNNPNQPYDYFFFWSYTKDRCKLDDVLMGATKVINKGCHDVTKSKVEQIFGQNMVIDPETYTGICVKKSELQARHDGELVQCPTPKESGFVYQKYIDTMEDGKYVYYRVYFSGTVDFVEKITKSQMFKSDSEMKFSIVSTHECLSKNQINDIVIGCQKFGMDFGELDVLIDKDGNSYVVDVNNVAGNIQRDRQTQIAFTNSFVNFLNKNK